MKTEKNAGNIGIIGGADGPTSVYPSVGFAVSFRLKHVFLAVCAFLWIVTALVLYRRKRA